jgi:DNA-binding NtrC family response regulator
MERKKALVIDDDQIVLDSVKRSLTEEEFDVETTLSSRKGIELAMDNDYDIVLTDVRMPDIDGLTVVRGVKEAKPQLPVLVITGYASVRSAVEAMKRGATDYVQKPFTPEALVTRVTSAIAGAAHCNTKAKD